MVESRVTVPVIITQQYAGEVAQKGLTFLHHKEKYGLRINSRNKLCKLWHCQIHAGAPHTFSTKFTTFVRFKTGLFVKIQ